MDPYLTPAAADAIGRRWKGHVLSWCASRDLAVASLAGIYKNLKGNHRVFLHYHVKLAGFHMFLFGEKTDWTNQWSIYRLWIDSNHGDTLHYSKVCFQIYSHELKTDVGIFNNIPNTKLKKMSAEWPWTFAEVAGSPSSVKESTEIVYLQTCHPDGKYYHQETYITLSSAFFGTKKISLREKNHKTQGLYFRFSCDGNWTTVTDLECGPATACMHGKG